MLDDLKKLVSPKTDEEVVIQRYKDILKGRSDPSPDIHLKIGRLYEKIGKNAEASIEYRQAAQLYMGLEEYVGALVANKLLIRFDRNDADALANVAFIELQQGITLSPAEFEIFLQDIGQSVRDSAQKHDSSGTKRLHSRLALDRNARQRRQTEEKSNSKFQTERLQLHDLITGDSERHSSGSAESRDVDIQSTAEPHQIPESAPSSPEKDDSEFIEEMPFIDLTRHDVPGTHLVDDERLQETLDLHSHELLSRLDDCPLFSELSGEEREMLQQEARLRKIEKGVSLSLEPDTPQVLCVLLEGSAELVLEGHTHGEEDVNGFSLKEGDFWGEHVLLQQTDVSCSVEVKSSGWIAEIPKTTLTLFAKHHPSLVDRLKKICKRRCFFSFLRGVALFHHLSMEEIQNIAEHLFLKKMKKGATLIREGECDQSIFLVQSGKVEVCSSLLEEQEQQVVKTGRESIHLAYLQEGDFFGEGAYFTNEPRSATIIALTDGHVLKLPTSHLKELISDYPRLEAELLQYHQQRVQSTIKTLQSALTP